MPMGTVIHVFFHQPRKVKKRTSLRSSQPMKFIISCKRPPPRSAPSGSKPSRWPPGLGSEDTPAAPHHPPEGTPQISSVQDLFTSGDTSTRKGPGMGTFYLRGFYMQLATCQAMSTCTPPDGSPQSLLLLVSPKQI